MFRFKSQSYGRLIPFTDSVVHAFSGNIVYLVLIIDAVVKLSCGLYLAESRLCRHAEANEMFRCLG